MDNDLEERPDGRQEVRKVSAVTLNTKPLSSEAGSTPPDTRALPGSSAKCSAWIICFNLHDYLTTATVNRKETETREILRLV